MTVHLKKFEEFDFSETLPVAPKTALISYYSCDDCDAVWKIFNSTMDKCPFCDSPEIEDLPKNEYYELVKARLGDPTEIDELEKEKQEDENSWIQLW